MDTGGEGLGEGDFRHQGSREHQDSLMFRRSKAVHHAQISEERNEDSEQCFREDTQRWRGLRVLWTGGTAGAGGCSRCPSLAHPSSTSHALKGKKMGHWLGGDI